MARPVGNFKQGVVERAIKGASKAGQRISRVEIDRAGKIVMFMDPEARPEGGNPWDAKVNELAAK